MHIQKLFVLLLNILQNTCRVINNAYICINKQTQNDMTTSIDTLKETVDFRITYASGGSFTIAFNKPTEIKGRGVKERYNDTTYEVTRSKLDKLEQEFTCTVDF